MKTIIAIMAILVMAGAAWGQQSNQDEVKKSCLKFWKQTEPTTCWEYKTLQGNKAIESVGITDWELVSMAMRIDQMQGGLYSTPVYIFKRPKKCEAK